MTNMLIGVSPMKRASRAPWREALTGGVQGPALGPLGVLMGFSCFEASRWALIDTVFENFL
jgi:hypothetical protein